MQAAFGWCNGESEPELKERRIRLDPIHFDLLLRARMYYSACPRETSMRPLDKKYVEDQSIPNGKISDYFLILL